MSTMAEQLCVLLGGDGEAYNLRLLYSEQKESLLDVGLSGEQADQALALFRSAEVQEDYENESFMVLKFTDGSYLIGEWDDFCESGGMLVAGNDLQRLLEEREE